MADKDKRLFDEIGIIQTCIEELDRQLVMDKVTVLEFIDSSKSILKDKLLDIIVILSSRVRDLRQHAVGKTLAREKFKTLGQPDWRKSRYAYVVSSIETNLCQIETCITSLVQIIDNMIGVVTVINGTAHMFLQGQQHVHLNNVPNQHCLTDNAYRTAKETRYMKQRSDEWFEKRKETRVTGMF